MPPGNDALEELHVRLVAEYLEPLLASDPQGGSAANCVPRIFRATAVGPQASTTEPSVVTTTRPRDISGGAPYMAVIPDGSGNYYVDAGPLQQQIDRLLPLLGRHYISARTLYDVRTDVLSADQAATLFRARVHECSWIVAPLHVRHHWVSAVFTNEARSMRCTIYDSAPSPITSSDYKRLFAQLHIPFSVICHARQPRASNECGLHVVFIAINLFRTWTTASTIQTWTNTSHVTHMACWRKPLSQILASGGLSHEHCESLLLALQSEVRTCTPEENPKPRTERQKCTGKKTITGAGPEAVAARLDAKMDALSEGGLISEEILDAAIEYVYKQTKRPDVTVWQTCIFDCWRTGEEVPKLSPTGTHFFPIRTKDHFTLLVIANNNAMLYDSLNRFASACKRRARQILHRLGVPEQFTTEQSAQQGLNECAIYVTRLVASTLGFNERVITRKWMVQIWEQSLVEPLVPQQERPDRHQPDLPPQPTTHASSMDKPGNIRRRCNNPYLSPAHTSEAAPQTTSTHITLEMKRSEVIKAIRDLREGQLIVIEWSHKRTTTVGKWIGQLHKPRVGLPRRFTLKAEYCDSCECWHRPEEIEEEWEIPFSNLRYLSVVRTTGLPELQDRACDDEEDGAEDDSAQDLAVEQEYHDKTRPNPAHELFGQAELHTETVPQIVDNLTLTGRVGQRWFLFPQRPPHVPMLAWRQLSESTRRNHSVWLQRIKGMPEDFCRAPLGTAVVELVKRFATKRNWTWPTIASALSCAGSALSQLPLYSNAIQPIAINNDRTFAAAVAHARHLARVSVREGKLSAPLSWENFAQLTRDTKERPTWLLTQLSWYLAARVGDLRQVRAHDIVIKPAEATVRDATTPNVPIVVTFRYGKGAAFWGPFSVHAMIPYRVAQALQEHLQPLDTTTAVFSTSDQTRMSHNVKQFQGCSLRSLRKGALTHFAQCGVADSSLMLISGHKKKETLLRYLGWGRESSSANAAAKEIAKKTTVVAGGADPAILPSKMGSFSGYWGHHGKRTSKPPEMFPLKAPSAEELGIAETVDTSSYTLHVKNVGHIDWAAVIQMASSTDMKSAIEQAYKWVHDPSLIDTAISYPKARIPTSAFSPQEVDCMLRAQKLRPLREDEIVLGWAKGFTTLQHHKKRKRPIFEPYANATIDVDSLLQLTYPSRRERRLLASGKRYVARFDFSAWFDQFVIPEPLQNRFVIKVKAEDGSFKFFCLTRLPMGARWSPSIAQHITWLITRELLADTEVTVTTIIDDIRIATSSPQAFIKAVKTFLQRCERLHATLNDPEEWKLSDEEILAKGENEAKKYTFLGEEYLETPDGTATRNTERNVQKLISAWNLLCNDQNYTRRKFASLIGLIIFMMGTVSQSLNSIPRTMRAHSAISRAALSEENWEATVKIAQPVLDELSSVCAFLTANQPALIGPESAAPTADPSAYDAIVYVDASASGYGFYVRLKDGPIYEVHGGWHSIQCHSAHSEPRAARLALQWLRENHPHAVNIAVVSDHEPMTTAQRRWHNHHGGFSGAWPLNDFFWALYANVPPNARRDVFYCPGETNIADGISRANRIGERLTAKIVHGITLPSLHHVHNPYMSLPERLIYHT